MKEFKDSPPKDSGFNIQKLEVRINDLRFDRSSVPVEGDFRWVNGERYGRVEFIAKKGGEFKLELKV